MRKTLLIWLSVLALVSCHTQRETVTREKSEGIAVTMRHSASVSGFDRDFERIVEVVTYEADSTGTMRETRRETTRTTEREAQTEKTADTVQKVVSTAFSSESDIITQQTKETTPQPAKTRFWRNFAFVCFPLALIGSFIIFLLLKIAIKWIKND